MHDLPREVADTGVKFASWGRTSDRFYTGASDGKVKAWDIRAAKGNAFVRNVLQVSGGISAGAFSKDFSKLVIGDATGKVHLLGIEDGGLVKGNNGGWRSSSLESHRGPWRGRPKAIIPHPDPPPPEGSETEIDEAEQMGLDVAQLFLLEGHLALHPDRKIGVIQGPNYHETRLYRSEAHEDNDGALPLLPEWQARQQYELRIQDDDDSTMSRLPIVKTSLPGLHAENMALNFDMSQLSLATQEDLRRDRVDLDWDDHMFDYDIVPRTKIFKKMERHARQSATRRVPSLQELPQQVCKAEL